MKNTTLPSNIVNFLFLKQTINLTKYTTQSIKDAIILNNNCGVVRTQTQLFGIKIMNKNIKVFQIDPICEINDTMVIVPYKEHNTFYIWQSDFYLVDLTNKLQDTEKRVQVKKINYRKVKKPFLMLFHQSKQIVQLNRFQEGELSYLHMQHISIASSIIGIGDSKSMLIKNIQKSDETTKIKFFNISTSLQTEIQLKQSLHELHISPKRIYITQQNNLIIGDLDDEILTIMLVYPVQKRISKKVVMQNIQFCQFYSFNQNKNLLLLIIQRRFEVEQKMILLNYSLGQIFQQFKRPQIYSNITKRWDTNFQNYLEIKKGENSLTRYFLPSKKKVFFDLFKKSKLKQKFGEGIIRPLLKCLL